MNGSNTTIYGQLAAIRYPAWDREKVGVALGAGAVAVCLFLAFWLLSSTARKQRAIAHRSSCVSNLNAVGIALSQYALDNDDWYPSSWVWDDARRTLGVIRGCPAASPMPDLPRLKASGVPGYALNDVLTVRKRSEVVLPATTVAVCEQAIGIPITRSVNPYEGFPLYPARIEKGWLRHGGGSHYLFCDGHVKWYAPGAVQSDTANDVLDVNNGKTPTFVIQSRPMSANPH